MFFPFTASKRPTDLHYRILSLRALGAARRKIKLVPLKTKA